MLRGLASKPRSVGSQPNTEPVPSAHRHHRDAPEAISIGGALWERRKISALSKLNVAMMGVVYYMPVMTYSL